MKDNPSFEEDRVEFERLFPTVCGLHTRMIPISETRRRS